MADQWRVVNNYGERPRQHFAGTEAGARAFVEQNFPRAHVEPPSQDDGIPDVKIVGPDGHEETFHADHGWSGSHDDAAESDDNELVVNDESN